MMRIQIGAMLSALIVFGLVQGARAAMLVDDFSTPHAPFGDAFDGEAVWDVPISGAGLASSRDGHSQLVVDGTLPGEVTAGQLVVTDLLSSSSQATLFMVYDAAGDATTSAVQTMPGGPFDLTGVTEFRIDASDLVGELTWFFAIGWGSGSAGSSTFSLANGVNAIPTTAIYSGVDFSDVRTIHFGVTNASETPGSVKLDNFRFQLVPEPTSLALLAVGSLTMWRRLIA